MIGKRLATFVRKHSLRFPLLLEIVLWSVPYVFQLASGKGGRRKPIRPRGALSRWLYASRTTVVANSVDTLMSRVRERGADRRWKERLQKGLFVAGNRFMISGNLVLAAKCLEASLELTPLASGVAVHNFRILGAAYFMLGDLENAHRAFERAGCGRRLILHSGAASPVVRNLGPGWFVAIGHAAMLDFYFKKRLLGWSNTDAAVLLTNEPSSIPGRMFVMGYRKYGLNVVNHLGIHRAYDRFRRTEDVSWTQLSQEDRAAIIDDFWEQEFPDGEVLTYTHAAAKVQHRWEEEERPPLLALDEENRETLRRLLRAAGVPEGSWYVCLHVREAGFHAQWNATYPTVRDADISDYALAIRTVTDRGGWVIRVGDPTMKRLPKMSHVVDYAHSNLKSDVGDVLLPAGCRCFIGSNSGYATVPGIYGVPNVLTNWVPIVLPLWFGQDLMIPKVFHDQRQDRLVDFETMFATRLGSTQNFHDLPPDMAVRSNTPEEISGVVVEMLDRLEGRLAYTPEDAALQDRYQSMAERLGSYRGSRIGRDFLRKYSDLVGGGDSSTAGATATFDHETPAKRRTAISGAP